MTPLTPLIDDTHVTADDGPVLSNGDEDSAPFAFPEPSPRPTRKWAAAVTASLGSLAVLGIQTGTGEAFQIAAVGVVVVAVTTYLTGDV